MDERNPEYAVATFFDDIKEGFKEAKASAAKKKLLLNNIEKFLEPPNQYSPDEIKAIRIRCRCSQSVFAKLLNVSLKTVRSWELGAQTPSGVALRLIEIIDKQSR